LDNLPDEIIVKILENTDCKTFIDLCSLSKRFEKLCNKNILSTILNKTTNLDTKNFTSTQLLNLCNMSKDNIVLTGVNDKILKIDDRGYLYYDDVLIYDKEIFVTVSNNEWFHDKGILLNDQGEVFVFDTKKSNIPVKMLDTKNNIQALMTHNDLYVLASDKKVYHFNDDTQELELVNDLDNVIKFIINGCFSIFIQSDGTIFGVNPTTQILEKISDDKFVDMGVNTSLYTLLLSIDGKVYYLDWYYEPHYGNILKFIKTPILSNIIKIYVTEHYSFAIDKDYNLYLLGYSNTTRYSKKQTATTLKIKKILGSIYRDIYMIDTDNKYKIYSRINGNDIVVSKN